MVTISTADLAIAFGLVALCLGLSWSLALGLERSLWIGAARSLLQLLAVGYVLKFLFAADRWYWVALALGVMLFFAGHMAIRRQQPPSRGAWLVAGGAIAAGSLVVLAIVIGAVVRPQPWYRPQYVIPLAGMIIGNAMNGVALMMERLAAEMEHRRPEIETALALGATSRQAAHPAVRNAIRAALIPTVNAMMVVGVVQLPGMMTGQIIAGAAPEQAVRYQIVVVYMITAAVMLACVLAARLAHRLFFTPDHQLQPAGPERLVRRPPSLRRKAGQGKEEVG